MAIHVLQPSHSCWRMPTLKSAKLDEQPLPRLALRRAMEYWSTCSATHISNIYHWPFIITRIPGAYTCTSWRVVSWMISEGCWGRTHPPPPHEETRFCFFIAGGTIWTTSVRDALCHCCKRDTLCQKDRLILLRGKQCSVCDKKNVDTTATQGLTCTYSGAIFHAECSTTFSKVGLDALAIVKEVCTPCPRCEVALCQHPAKVASLEKWLQDFVEKTEAALNNVLPASHVAAISAVRSQCTSVNNNVDKGVVTPGRQMQLIYKIRNHRIMMLAL